MQDARSAARQYATYLLSEEISPLLFEREAQKKFASNVAELGETGIEAMLDDLNARESRWGAAFKLIAERRCAQQRFAQPRETAEEALAAVAGDHEAALRALSFDPVHEAVWVGSDTGRVSCFAVPTAARSSSSATIHNSRL